MTILLLVAAHFICDTVLQPEHVSKYKNPNAIKPVGFNQTTWPYLMAGHAATHAMAVYLITGNINLFICEFILHFTIDVVKCKGGYGRDYHMHIDQALHIACKLLYLGVL